MSRLGAVAAYDAARIRFELGDAVRQRREELGLTTGEVSEVAGSMNENVYGHTKKGTPITDAMVEELAKEAERGYDVEELLARRRSRGRPRLGKAAKTVGSVRLDPELREETARRAEAEGVSVSEIVRRALREYLR